MGRMALNVRAMWGYIAPSKVMIYPRTFHYPVCGMAGFDLVINRYREIGNRTVPDVMIAFCHAAENI
jgi:hypothetical protein